MKRVLKYGEEGTYKEVFKKELMIDGENVVVTYNKYDGRIKIGTAYIEE